MKKLLISVFVLLLTTAGIFSQQLAFPTAKGAGAYATGGRGGQVIHVNTLDWDAPLVNSGGVLYGGLRDAIQTTGDRTIVFDVSGEIDATQQGGFSFLITGSSYDNLTIAGQTAPLGGITIKTSEFRFNDVDNIIIRYITFRRTDQVFSGYSQDVIGVLGGTDIIFDHCTFSHGNDEGASWAHSTGFMDNITIQNCFIQDSKTGSIIGVTNSSGGYTFLNNVITNTSHRFPNSKSNGQVDIIGNVIYNWRERLVRLGDVGTFDGRANVINNYYKGSSNGINQNGWFSDYNVPITRLHRAQVNDASTGQIYSSGSYIYIQRTTPQTDDSDMWSVFDGSSLSGVSVGAALPSSFFVSTQFTLLGQSYTIDTAENYYTELVTSGNVGNYKRLNADGTVTVDRDSRDTQRLTEIINDSYNGGFYDSVTTYGYPTISSNTRASGYDTDGDGIPDTYEDANGTDKGNGADGALIAGNGYSNLENFLNEVDEGVVQTPIAVTAVDVTPVNSTIEVGQTQQLFVAITPSTATTQSGNWGSSNNAVATVNQSGLITAIAEGTSTVTFTADDRTNGIITDTHIITVTAQTVLNSGGASRLLKTILINN